MVSAQAFVDSSHSATCSISYGHCPGSSLHSLDHKPLFSACCTSLVEQASSYSSCSLAVWFIIITQLFSIVML